MKEEEEEKSDFWGVEIAEPESAGSQDLRNPSNILPGCKFIFSDSSLATSLKAIVSLVPQEKQMQIHIPDDSAS